MPDTSPAPLSSTDAVDRAGHWLFAATVALATGLVWLAPRLPMVDLPQHAGQVALWRDLALGVSGWSDLVHVNLLTPYLIGYGAMLPLSLLVPIGVATQIVLTLAWLAFVAAGLALRRAVAADARLDWLLLWGFFGFAWHWGLLTFLVAAPLGLCFILVARAHARAPTLRRTLAVLAAGLVLLLSHGLLFLAALGIGALQAFWLARSAGWRILAALALPYAVLAGLCAAFRIATGRLDGSMQFDRAIYGIPLWMRPSAVLVFVTDQDNTSAVLVGLTLLVCTTPWLLRCRFNPNEAAAIFAGLVLVLLAVPAYAFQTDLLFQRFALFLLPCFSLVFRPAAGGPPPRSRRLLVLAVLALSSWGMIGVAAARILAFRSESRPFETVLAAAAPGRRALGLIYDPDSPAAGNEDAYMHFALWYQAEKHGFVDFNFAAFHPQVVRFRPGRQPPIDQRIGPVPQDFDWGRSQGAAYDYVFVREKQGSEAADLVATSPCVYRVAAADKPWVLLERRSCPS